MTSSSEPRAVASAGRWRPPRGRRSIYLILGVVAVAVLPMIGSVVRFGGLPPGMDTFPPNISAAAKPGFNAIWFAACAAVGVVLLAFLLVPSWFGFRERGGRRRLAEGHLPWWFWVGGVVCAASWVAHWWGSASVALFSFLPLWWGMIVAIDGIVYARASGRSLLATHPLRMLTIALASIPAWGIFELVNYAALDFWVYPSHQLLSPTAQTLWYLVSFTVVLPGIFEWYTLLHTIDPLWNRWRHGPRLTLSTRHLGFVVVVGAAALVLFGAFPFQLFFVLWLGPPIVLTAALLRQRYWTPLHPIRRGDWSPVVLIGLASLVNGVLYELWNYGSWFFHGGSYTTNPNYWFYEVPYVDVLHPFSEMPLLGYLGYLPFGFLTWVCWLVAAHVTGSPRQFDLTRSATSR